MMEEFHFGFGQYCLWQSGSLNEQDAGVSFGVSMILLVTGNFKVLVKVLEVSPYVTSLERDCSNQPPGQK